MLNFNSLLHLLVAKLENIGSKICIYLRAKWYILISKLVFVWEQNGYIFLAKLVNIERKIEIYWLQNWYIFGIKMGVYLVAKLVNIGTRIGIYLGALNFMAEWRFSQYIGISDEAC